MPMIALKNTGPGGLLMGRLPAIPARTLTPYCTHFICRVGIRQDFRDKINSLFGLLQNTHIIEKSEYRFNFAGNLSINGEHHATSN
jgi:hypothetical protein